MWISKRKFNALCHRLERLESFRERTERSPNPHIRVSSPIELERAIGTQHDLIDLILKHFSLRIVDHPPHKELVTYDREREAHRYVDPAGGPNRV